MTSKLTIRSKLAAALAVPLIALAALVAVQVRDSVGDTNNAHTQADLATSATGPAGIVSALQNERNLQGARAIGADKQVDLPVKTAPEATAATDKAITDFRSSLDNLDPQAADAYLPALAAIERGIGDIRKTADTLGATPSLDAAHQQAANTATGSIGRSPHANDHSASSSTIHHSSGRYGFHGSVSVPTPYPRTRNARTAATPITRR